MKVNDPQISYNINLFVKNPYYRIDLACLLFRIAGMNFVNIKDIWVHNLALPVAGTDVRAHISFPHDEHATTQLAYERKLERTEK